MPEAAGVGGPGDGARCSRVVAAKTGYPQDMLDLELDLEADLGIDTVKQAETFAAIREAFDIPVQENLSLRDYPTLQSVVGFVYQFRPDLRQDRCSALRALKPNAPTVRRRPPVSSRRLRQNAVDPVTPKVLASRGDEDRLPAGHARPRAGPGSRPGHRHGEAGRDVRRDPRGVRHPGPGEPLAARLPDAAERRRLRLQVPARPGVRERRRARRTSPREAAPAEAPAAADPWQSPSTP